MRRLLALLASALLVGLAAPAAASTPSGGGPSAPDEELPVDHNYANALAYAAAHPNGPPPGANDWACRPAPEHPNPVVLVHGSIENMAQNWYALAPLLRNEGYCVYALNYGQEEGAPRVGFPGAHPPGGTGPVERSAAELSAFVGRVRASTGADQVDIVGHSQGGMMPRYYLRELGGAVEVGKLVGLSPSNHGTTVFGIGRLPGVDAVLGAGLGPAFRQQIAGSDFLERLNAGGDTVPGVDYTVIQTRYDEVVTPHTSAFLEGPNARNVLLQDGCPADRSDHLASPFSPRSAAFVLNALDPEHPVPVPCEPVAPVVGG
ncbi:esterase/lipase family protein [Salinifilum ghardaiensis]